MSHHLAKLWERRASRLLRESVRYEPGDLAGERRIAQAQAYQMAAAELLGRLETERYARDQMTTAKMQDHDRG